MASRLARFANFMDAGPVTCFHDLSRSVDGPEDYFDRIEKPLMGVVDTGMSLVPGVVERYANHPWLLIVRDPTDVVASAVRGLGESEVRWVPT